MNKLVIMSMVCTSLFIVSCNENGTGSSYGNKGITGVGGSIARMTITGDSLYAIAGHNVQLLDISVPASQHLGLKGKMIGILKFYFLMVIISAWVLRMECTFWTTRPPHPHRMLETSNMLVR
jgi:hypothetical protein